MRNRKFSDIRYCPLLLKPSDRPQGCGAWPTHPQWIDDCTSCPKYIQEKHIRFRGVRLAKKTYKTGTVIPTVNNQGLERLEKYKERNKKLSDSIYEFLQKFPKDKDNMVLCTVKEICKNFNVTVFIAITCLNILRQEKKITRIRRLIKIL